MIVLSGIILAAAAATSAPRQVDRVCVPMNVMLAFGSKALPIAPENACRTFPANQRVLDAAKVDAGYIEPFFDVMNYRQYYPSATPVNHNPGNVNVVFAKYGRFILVILADNYLHRDRSGRPVLGCDGLEYYRVDGARHDVLPFDGCVESHKRVLPALSQLPQ